MSGYGMPQGPAPGSTRSGRNAPALPVLELVGVGLAVLAFVVAFLPWAKADVPDDVDGASAKGWDLPLPTAAVVLLLVAAILLVAPLLARRAGAGATADADDATGPASPVPALLAVLAALLLVVYAIKGTGDLDRGIGTWLGLVLGLGTAAVLVLSWLQRTGRVKKAPAAGPSNWQGQPQGWGQPGGYQPQQSQGYGQPAERPASQPQPPAYGQQPSYGAPGGYPGPSTGGQPAQQPAPYGQEPYPPPSGGYPAQGGYNPQG
jgi:hypothetical protein